MDRYSTNDDDDLQLGTLLGNASKLDIRRVDSRLCVIHSHLGALDFRLGLVEKQLWGFKAGLAAVETQLVAVETWLDLVEERLSHTATTSWVLGCAVAVLAAGLAGTLGGFWWILQQYIGPLLRASAG